jgi:methylenetetrahydrofolate dehydrogenase (NADP+) / methenyltetrahydrofolate cyclohydrolase
MIVDGKAIANRIYDEIAKEVATLSRVPVLAAVTCAPNFETKKYLELKKKKAAEVGILLEVVELEDNISTTEAIAAIEALLPSVDGVVVQLPFPPHIDRELLLQSIPANKDPDGFGYGKKEGSCLPPVVAAISEIAKTYEFDFKNKKVAVLGQGRLVGIPVAIFLEREGAEVTVVTEDNKAPQEILQNTEVVVSGIGKPNFITVDDIPQGVVVFDAGTSEDGGLMVGDVHPNVVFKASLITPVPGGIGPITIAVLLRNLVSLVRQ